MSDYEAYTYIWRDSINRKFYIGYHKGLVEDNYAHSSTAMESFNMDSVPPGFTQRILAYGTHEEMCELENKLLVNRKNKGDWKWDQYHNNWLGDPRFIDQSGENHPRYGKTLSEDHKRKISEAKLGKTLSEYHKRKISEAKSGEKNPMYGRTHSPEARKKMSDRTLSEDHKRKLSEAMSGKTLSEDHKRKISEAMSGKTLSEDHKRKISEAKKRIHSKQTTQSTLEKFF